MGLATNWRSAYIKQIEKRKMREKESQDRNRSAYIKQIEKEKMRENNLKVVNSCTLIAFIIVLGSHNLSKLNATTYCLINCNFIQ